MKSLMKNKKGQVLAFAGVAAALMGIVTGKYFLMFIGAILFLIGFLPFLNISAIPWYVWGVVILVTVIAFTGKK